MLKLTVVTILLSVCTALANPDGIDKSATPKPNVKIQRSKITSKAILRIANSKAKAAGYRLSDYKKPRVESSEDGSFLNVYYERKFAAPGGHFFVKVENKNGNAELLKGE